MFLYALVTLINNTLFVLLGRVGRRLSFFTCLATLIIGGFLTAISNSFWTWASTRFIVGLTIPAIYQIPFIICKHLNFAINLHFAIEIIIHIGEQRYIFIY